MFAYKNALLFWLSDDREIGDRGYWEYFQRPFMFLDHKHHQNTGNLSNITFILQTLDISQYNITWYRSQHNKFEGKISVRLEYTKDTHTLP